MPINVFEFDQLMIALPTLLVNGMFTPSPGQNDWLITAVTTGSGLTVILNVLTGPGQPPRIADTPMFAIIGTPEILTGATNAEMFPTPLAGMPIEVLSFVQLNVSLPPVLAENAIAAIGAPEQTVTSVIVLTIGVGLILIVNVFTLAPMLVQVLAVADTVIVPMMSAPVLFAGAVNAMLPVPLATRPIAVLSLVQFIVALPTLLANGILITSAGQNSLLVTAVTIGSGLIVTVSVKVAPEHAGNPPLIGVM